MENEIRGMLRAHGADLVCFADISGLPAGQTRGFPGAVVICMALPRGFILATRNGEPTGRDEFLEKERAVDGLADRLAEHLQAKGWRAFPQSEAALMKNGGFDAATRSSRLPHKTIARLAGMGFVGKNNLLVTREYGCGFCMCTVLTDAPLAVEKRPPQEPGCGACEVCKTVCPAHAIHGVEWSEEGGRDAVVDVFKCACALRCVVNCPRTLEYALGVSP